MFIIGHAGKASCLRARLSSNVGPHKLTSMGIDASWNTESGEPKQQVFDPRQCLTALATTRWNKLDHTKCLQFVDPWGDAVFNQAQIPHLLEELRIELREPTEPDVKAHLEKVLRLVERAVDRTHTYIKFTGD